MYKKIILFTILFCIFKHCLSQVTPWIEVKPSYFFFLENPMKQIYTDGAFQIQGSASVPMSNYLDMYGSIGYRNASGHALSTGEKTNLKVIPFDIGVKPILRLGKRFYSFFTIGPRFFSFIQHNKSPYVDRKIHDTGVGFFVNTGINIQLKQILFGIFGEYSYEKKTVFSNIKNVFSNGNTQIGGFAFGISIGYAF